jgi:hypothetical protein
MQYEATIGVSCFFKRKVGGGPAWKTLGTELPRDCDESKASRASKKEKRNFSLTGVDSCDRERLEDSNCYPVRRNYPEVSFIRSSPQLYEQITRNAHCYSSAYS